MSQLLFFFFFYWNVLLCTFFSPLCCFHCFIVKGKTSNCCRKLCRDATLFFLIGSPESVQRKAFWPRATYQTGARGKSLLQPFLLLHQMNRHSSQAWKRTLLIKQEAAEDSIQTQTPVCIRGKPATSAAEPSTRLTCCVCGETAVPV